MKKNMKPFAFLIRFISVTDLIIGHIKADPEGFFEGRNTE